MANPITVDLDKARAAVAALKRKPPKHEDIAKDPKAFLATLGVKIDKKTHDAIKSKLAARPGLSSAPNQAAILHIDTG